MGEAKRRKLGVVNGEAKAAVPTTPGVHQVAPALIKRRRVELYPALGIQNVIAENHGVLMLGHPNDMRVGVMMQPGEMRVLANALLQHADELDQNSPKIIVPGGLVHAPGGIIHA